MTTRISAILILALVIPAAASGQTPTDFVMMPARDGVALATDVWIPGDDASTAWPVMLRRTPYGRVFSTQEVQVWNDMGFALVSQDVRGRGSSEGRFLPFFNDAEDGYDAVEWVASQPWSNGRIATFGGSAEGIVQYMMLSAAPPSLDCSWITVATDDVYEGMLPGGTWRPELTTDWLSALEAPDVEVEWRANADGGSYWDPARLSETERAGVTVPVVTIGGFYDIFNIGTPRSHRLFLQQAAPDARRHQHLIYGPWTHGSMMAQEGESELYEGELVYPDDAGYRYMWFDMIDYFEWCLLEGPEPTWAPVRYFRTRIEDDGRHAGGTWLTAETWPPEGARSATLHLHHDGLMRAALPGGTSLPIVLSADPTDPVPSRGGGNLTTPAGVFNVADIDQREDVFATHTIAFEAPVVIEGDLRAHIWASSDTEDVDVVVRFSQFTPSGRVMQLTDGVLRGRLRHGPGQLVPMTPDEPTLFDVELGPVAIEVSPGHALQVSVQVTSARRYEPNPEARELTIYCDEAHPSAILLPIVEGTLPGEESQIGSPEPDADAGETSETTSGTDEDCPVPTPCESCSSGCGAGLRPNALPWSLLLVLLLGLYSVRHRASYATRTP